MSSGYPSTYHSPEDNARRPTFFDPALKHFGAALRQGEPEFDDRQDARVWRLIQSRATDHVLRLIAESRWGSQLVLRGSRLLRAWLGDTAREPGDLDYVVRPADLSPAHRSAAEMMDGLVATMASRPAPNGIIFPRQEVTRDDIWTYERAEGRRIVFPWRVPGLPDGVVQVDIVFREEFDEPPITSSVELYDGNVIEMPAASPGQSLAWKLLWLDSDSYPQGKDLYDATILAERVFLPRELLERTLAKSEGGGGRRISPSTLVENWTVDWENFQKECPWIEGDRNHWQNRLIKALKPTYSDCEQPERSFFVPAGWRTPEVIALSQGIVEERAFGRLPILADALEEAGCEDLELLAHCRSGGDHDGSCWVTDLLLRGSNSV